MVNLGATTPQVSTHPTCTMTRKKIVEKMFRFVLSIVFSKMISKSIIITHICFSMVFANMLKNVQNMFIDRNCFRKMVFENMCSKCVFDVLVKQRLVDCSDCVSTCFCRKRISKKQLYLIPMCFPKKSKNK